MMPAPCGSSLLDLDFPSSAVPRHTAICVQDDLSEPGSPEHENPGQGFLDPVTVLPEPKPPGREIPGQGQPGRRATGTWATRVHPYRPWTTREHALTCCGMGRGLLSTLIGSLIGEARARGVGGGAARPGAAGLRDRVALAEGAAAGDRKSVV